MTRSGQPPFMMPTNKTTLSCHPHPQFRITFGGGDAFREPLVIDASEFIGVKGFKAKGKRITTFQIESVTELKPAEEEPAAPEYSPEGNPEEETEETRTEESQETPSDDENGDREQLSLF